MSIELNRLSGSNNYQWDVDTDYETYCPCQHGSDCCDGDMCRCGEIRNARVTSVDIQGLVKSRFGDLPELTRYVADRILRVNKIWENDNWSVDVEGGYYGQEISGVTLLNAADIDADIDRISSLPEVEIIPELLKIEYGYLLDEVCLIF